MFCKNCGKELAGAPESCIDCGADPMAGTSFCPGCGAPITPLTEVCANCGVQVATATKGKTWKSRTAGILAIVAGAGGAIQLIWVAVLEILALGWSTLGDVLGPAGITVAAIVMTSEIVAIVGGVFALKRRRWRLALAGCICAIFSVMAIPVLLNVPLAIAAIVLIVLGKGEFE